MFTEDVTVAGRAVRARELMALVDHVLEECYDGRKLSTDVVGGLREALAHANRTLERCWT